MDNTGDQSEKRKHPRKSLDVMVNFKKTHIARSKDISEGGICLICDEALEIGAFLNLVFYLPNKEEVKTIGKIKWSKKASESYFEYGIEFWQLTDHEQTKICNYLDSEID
jgi:hypothetical protein